MTPASASELVNDEDRLMLLVHYLEILGEAANGVSETTRRKDPGIPWAAMASARNRLTHGYFDVDADAVFEMASRDVPAMRAHCLHSLRPSGAENAESTRIVLLVSSPCSARFLHRLHRRTRKASGPFLLYGLEEIHG